MFRVPSEFELKKKEGSLKIGTCILPTFSTSLGTEGVGCLKV